MSTLLNRFKSNQYSNLPQHDEQDPQHHLHSNQIICQSNEKRVFSRSIHPLSLLPAFVLGIIFTFLSTQTTAPWLSSSSISKKIFAQKVNASIISHRDHIYFPKDYLNRSYNFFNISNDPSTFLEKTSNLTDYPLVELIKNARLMWKEKLNRQSKNLNQAIKEYERRYNRPPPLGFQKWFEWAKANNVILIDEYDRINELIEPFWALPPHVIRARAAKAGQDPAFSTFVIKDGKVETIGAKKDVPRTHEHLKMLKVMLPHLPNLNITMSHHDGPSVFMDWITRQKHLEHARNGTVLPPQEIDKVQDNASLRGFVGACAPDSPMRMLANGFGHDLLSVRSAGPGGYIGLDHAKTMDMCQHPEWQALQGFTSWDGPPPQTLRPIFSFAQSPAFASDLLNVPLEQFDDASKNLKNVKPWSEKKNGQQLLWRGRTTGVWFNRIADWRKSHRVRLHRLGQAYKNDYGHFLKRPLRTPVLVKSNKMYNTQDMMVIEKEYSLAELSKRYLSISFVGELVQCTIEDGSCEAVGKELQFEKPVDWKFENEYKYVIDIDGNSWSGRFRRLLTSNSLVFKSTIWPEWYRDHIQAWYHYIPVRVDYEELFDLMSFFTGSMEEDNDYTKYEYLKFEELGRQISEQGHEWVQKHFRYEDLQAYAWRTYLEWARVSSEDRKGMIL
ncbi:hypothetical protein O181_023909 [Austropuccinia psidii MF-1]|uniref:Glycosyl transferase CAP10 domain-containing protein n=1 Tax=Austropuccinia psidii MF-1 TaxID=1389203 RepID=A0A9Q3GZ52_9BASI|nr:hypothetical protein [Austropuccinia psidii MF-1]